MTKEQIENLKSRLKWFVDWHGNNKPESVLTTILANATKCYHLLPFATICYHLVDFGTFKVPEKGARKILKDAVKLKLVKLVNGVAIII